MVNDYLAEMARSEATGPGFIGGYSFGSTVAIALAQWWEAQYGKVEAVLLLDAFFTFHTCHLEPAEAEEEEESQLAQPAFKELLSSN